MKTSTLLWTWIIVAVVLAAITTLFLSTASWRTFLLILGIVLVVTFMLRRFSPLKPNPQFAVFCIMTEIGIVLGITSHYLGFTLPPSVAMPVVLIWLALSAFVGMLWPFSRHHNELINKLSTLKDD